MDEKTRNIVTKDQINSFFSSYYTEWRLIQLLSIKKRLDNRYQFYEEIVEEIKLTDLDAGKNTIAQQIRSGLVFEAVSDCVQYIEDLFALIKATENKYYFIRNIIKYKASKISNFINNFDIDRKTVCKCFYFPNFFDEKIETEKEKETMTVINSSVDRLGKSLKEIIEFYKKNIFFYNQFKHGLTIALRPYGVKYNSEQIKKDKNGEYEDFSIIAHDSLNFKNAMNNKYGYAGTLMIPGFTENVQKNLKELQAENNLLRYVLSPQETTLNNIIDIAKKIRRCMHILINNFLEVVNEKEVLKLRLPSETLDQDYFFDINEEDYNAP